MKERIFQHSLAHLSPRSWTPKAVALTDIGTKEGQGKGQVTMAVEDK